MRKKLNSSFESDAARVFPDIIGAKAPIGGVKAQRASLLRCGSQVARTIAAIMNSEHIENHNVKNMMSIEFYRCQRQRLQRCSRVR